MLNEITQEQQRLFKVVLHQSLFSTIEIAANSVEEAKDKAIKGDFMSGDITDIDIHDHEVMETAEIKK